MIHLWTYLLSTGRKYILLDLLRIKKLLGQMPLRNVLFNKPSWGLWDDETPKNDKLKMTHVLLFHYPFFHWDESEESLLLLLLWRGVEYKLSRKGTVSFLTPIYVWNQYWDPRTSRKLKFQFFLEIKLFGKIKRNGSIEFLMEDGWLNFVNFWILCIICKTCSFLGLFNILVPCKLTILFTWWGILCRQLR